MQSLPPSASGPRQESLTLVLLVLIGLVLIVVGVVVGWAGGAWIRPDTGRPKLTDTPTVLREIQGLNQLVTVKYVLEKVVLLEDVKWYGGNRLLLIGHGIAKAGVDLAKLRPADVKVSGDRVKLSLPHAQVLDCYLDDRHTQVVERTTGLLREFDKDLEQDARRQAVDQIRLAAREAGIVKDAEERARLQLNELFRRAGFVSVEIEFH